MGRRSWRILGQAVRADGQAEQLVAEAGQLSWELVALEILGDQRIVGRLDAELHRKVETGRCLAGAGDADEDHVSLFEVGVGNTVRRGPV